MASKKEIINSFCLDINLKKTEFVKTGIDKIPSAKRLLDFIENIFKVHFQTVSALNTEKVSTQILVSGDGKAITTLRLYDRRGTESSIDSGDTAGLLLTLSLEISGCFDTREVDTSLEEFVFEERQRISKDDQLIAAPDQKCITHYPPIKRGRKYSSYFRTADGRWCDYKIDDIVYDVRSEHQHVMIMKTMDFGKLLFLDGYANLAESDTVHYTHSLMNLPEETANYADSKVLILGGGDGGLLKELLELPKPPKQVIMIDLDDAVMIGCSEHMRSVSGSYMDKDKRKGSNYEVICGDAIEYMEKAKVRGEKYDYIFGDLTDTPVDPGNSETSKDIWNFLRYILTLGMQLIVPNTGKYLTHYNGKSVSSMISKYEEMLQELRVESDPSLRPTFKQGECYVPSFLETWIFYKISMCNQ